MQWLAALCVRRPVFASVLILSLTVIGGFAFFRLGVDRFPKVDLPTIMITTRLPGAAPEQVETEISDKIEEAVNTISGIDELRSVSSEGVSQVIVTFLLEKNVDVGAEDDRLNLAQLLAEMFPQENCQAVGLFAAGASQTPEAQRPGTVFIAGAEEPGQHLIPQFNEHGRVSEKLADMDGERLLEQIQLLRALPQQVAVLGRIPAACGAHTDGDPPLHALVFVGRHVDGAPHAQDRADFCQLVVRDLCMYRQGIVSRGCRHR